MFEWHEIELLESDKGIKKYANTPFIFERGYITFGYRNAALFRAKNSLFEMFLIFVECSINKCLAWFFDR